MYTRLKPPTLKEVVKTAMRERKVADDLAVLAKMASKAADWPGINKKKLISYLDPNLASVWSSCQDTVIAGLCTALELPPEYLHDIKTKHKEYKKDVNYVHKKRKG